MIRERSFEVFLTTIEEFRIGGKPDPFSGIENPIAVVGDRAVVPGPSLKGAYRAELERYLIDTYFDKERGQWTNEDMKPCIPSTKLSKDENLLVERGFYRFYNRRYDRNEFKGNGCHYPCNTKRQCREGAHAICPVCYLLGANGLNGFVRVPFLTSIVKADELYSASIDRAVGTVKEGTNRPYQIIAEDTEFRGKMVVIVENDILGWKLGAARPVKEETKGDFWLEGNSWDKEKIIKELIVDRIKNIGMLGGFKSKGCGAVRIEVKEIK